MKKRLFCCLLAAILLLCCGCDAFKVKHDTFSIPQEMVDYVEIQKEYRNEDDKAYYLKKDITELTDQELVCKMIRRLDVQRASSTEPHPMTESPLIIILHGAAEHRLILSEEKAFYDQIPYVYTKSGVFESFMELYDNLAYNEEETEPSRL